MIKPIVRDAFFLNQKSEKATKVDLPAVQDMEDTLRANRERCVGMAANMIGYRKRIIIVATGFADIIMITPALHTKGTFKEIAKGKGQVVFRRCHHGRRILVSGTVRIQSLH